MSLDFQQVRAQIQALGEMAPRRAQQLKNLRQQALDLLHEYAQESDLLRQKVQRARAHDPNLRCALPGQAPCACCEPLDGHWSAPPLPPQATILAADGSQIAPDRHAEVNYCLINVGAIQMRLGQPEAPSIDVQTQLLYDEELYTESGIMTEARVALLRDLNERTRLASLAEGATPPVITFTDGPMELWGAKDSQDAAEYQRSLDEYQTVLRRLCDLDAITAGYVDKPAAGLVVRLLEVAMASESQLAEIKNYYPLRGVIDLDLFRRLLTPGERSPVYAIQSRSAPHYSNELALHFFYLNVGREGHSWPARVEIPAWVAADAHKLDDLHAVLVGQCQVMGSRAYPYLLHRAHEAAVVSLQEKEQVTQMITHELRSKGVDVGETSHKQAGKDLQGRTRFKPGGRSR